MVYTRSRGQKSSALLKTEPLYKQAFHTLVRISNFKHYSHFVPCSTHIQPKLSVLCIKGRIRWGHFCRVTTLSKTFKAPVQRIVYRIYLECFLLRITSLPGADRDKVGMGEWGCVLPNSWPPTLTVQKGLGRTESLTNVLLSFCGWFVVASERWVSWPYARSWH